MSQDKVGGRSISNGMAAAVLAVILFAAAGVILWLQFGNNGGDETPAPTTSSSAVTSTPAETSPVTPLPSEPTASQPAEPSTMPEPYVQDKPYAGTIEAMEEWAPVRAKFMQALIGDGNIAAAAEGTTTPEVQARLEKLEDGQYSDIEFPEEPIAYGGMTVEPYSYTETMLSTDERSITATVELIYENGKAEWKVSDFSVN